MLRKTFILATLLFVALQGIPFETCARPYDHDSPAAILVGEVQELISQRHNKDSTTMQEISNWLDDLLYSEPYCRPQLEYGEEPLHKVLTHNLKQIETQDGKKEATTALLNFLLRAISASALPIQKSRLVYYYSVARDFFYKEGHINANNFPKLGQRWARSVSHLQNTYAADLFPFKNAPDESCQLYEEPYDYMIRRFHTSPGREYFAFLLLSDWEADCSRIQNVTSLMTCFQRLRIFRDNLRYDEIMPLEGGTALTFAHTENMVGLTFTLYQRELKTLNEFYAALVRGFGRGNNLTPEQAFERLKNNFLYKMDDLPYATEAGRYFIKAQSEIDYIRTWLIRDNYVSKTFPEWFWDQKGEVLGTEVNLPSLVGGAVILVTTAVILTFIYQRTLHK